MAKNGLNLISYFVSDAYHNHFMNNSPAFSYQLFSPLLHQAPSPFLSPFPQLRKISDDISDLISFKLQHEPRSNNFPECESHSPSESNQILKNGYSLGFNQVQQKEEECEAISPANTHRCQMPSTRFHEHKEQQQPPFFSLSSQDPQISIKNMIQFLVQHSQLREDLLYLQGKRFYEIGNGAQEIFKVLSIKFRKLKKTKEELTKYCMRKAFKYVAELGRRDGGGRGLEGSMKRYFAEQDDAESFSVPFKKSSSQKTMNGNFLKRIFGCPRFAADYRSFLNEFIGLIKQDNERKVIYLVSMIEQAIKQNNLAKIESIKRLPWTNQILIQTKQLAVSLTEQGNGRRAKKSD